MGLWLNTKLVEKQYKQQKDILKSKSLKEFLSKVLESGVSTNQRRVLTQNYRKLHPEISLCKIRYEWEKLTGRDTQRWKPSPEFRRNYYYKRSAETNHRPDPKKRYLWQEEDIIKFISMNKKIQPNRYEYFDSYLAMEFSTTIHAIKYWRRKYKLTLLILEERGMRLHKKNLLFYMVCGEKPLKDYYEKIKDSNMK